MQALINLEALLDDAMLESVGAYRPPHPYVPRANDWLLNGPWVRGKFLIRLHEKVTIWAVETSEDKSSILTEVPLMNRVMTNGEFLNFYAGIY